MNTVAGAMIVVGLAVLIWRAVEAIIESCENIRQDVQAERSFVASCPHCNVDDS